VYDPYNPYEGKSSKIEVNFKRNRAPAKKSGVGAVNAGGAVIIIIFVILCLTIFGLLSFATSFADKKLADKTLSNAAQYYSADLAAEEKLAMIYDAVRSKLASGGSLLESVLAVDGAVPFEIAGVTVDGAPDESNETEWAYVEYRTRIDETSKKTEVSFYLDSCVAFCHNKNTGELSYKISAWNVVMESEFDYGDKEMNIWDGNFD